MQQSWIENVEVLVLDELDTASNSVIKSLREIIILRSVNGKKMKNLKSVIGISNSFELLERPDLERYHLKIEVSREIDWKYFEKYLNQYPLEKLQRLANAANLTTRQLEYLLLAHSMNLLYVANIPEKTIYLAQEILSEKYVPLQKIYERCLNNEPLSEEEARNFLGSLKIILQSKHRKTKKLLGILAKIKEKFLTSFNNDSEFVQGLLGFAELRNL